MTDFFNIPQAVSLGQQIGMKAFAQSGEADKEAASTRSITANAKGQELANTQVMSDATKTADINKGLVDAWRPANKPAQTKPFTQNQLNPTAMDMPNIQRGPAPLPMEDFKYPQSTDAGSGSLAQAVVPTDTGKYNFPEVNPTGAPRPGSVQAFDVPPGSTRTYTNWNAGEGKVGATMPIPPGQIPGAIPAPLPSNRPDDPSTPDHPVAAMGSNPDNLNMADTSGAANGQIAPTHTTKEGSFDRTKFLQGLIEKGHGLEAMKWQKQFALDDLTAEKGKTEMMLQKNATVYGKLKAIEYLPVSMRQGEWTKERQELVNQGYDPDMIPPNYTPANLKEMATQSLEVGKQLEQRHKDASDAYHSLNAETARIRALKEAHPDYMEVKTKEGVFMVNKKDPTQPLIRVGDLPPTGSGAAQPADAFSEDKTDYTKPLPNQQAEGNAIDFADGKPLPVLNSRTTPAERASVIRGREIYKALNNGDSQGYGTNAGVLKKARESWAPGGQQLGVANAVDVAVGHLEARDNYITAMKNGDMAGMNKAANYFKTRFNLSTAPNNLKTINTLLAPEVAKVVKGSTQTNESEIQDIKEKLGDDLAGEIQKDSGNVIRQAMGTRLEVMKKNYETAYPGKSLSRVLQPTTIKTFGHVFGEGAQAKEEAKPETKLPEGVKESGTENGVTWYRWASDGKRHTAKPTGSK